MMNKKGMTLVEIIISIALISIILLFLFGLLVSVNDINKESEVNSSYLINKSLILKNIEEELSDAISVKLSRCEVDDFYTSYSVPSENKYKVNQCIALTYYNSLVQDSTTQIGDKAYIGIYYYPTKSKYVISYIHGNVKATRLLEEYEKYNVNQSAGTLKNDNFRIKYVNANNVSSFYDTLSSEVSSSGFQKIVIPIIGPDEKDYSIIISYYGTVTIG